MNFREIIKEHQTRYPLMKPQDFGKLSYQSEFGPKHMGLLYENVLKGVEKEWTCDDIIYEKCHTEYIGNEYYRCHFWKNPKQYEKELFAKVFVLTANRSSGTLDGLKNRLKQVRQQEIDGMDEWIEEYEDAGYPVVSHTDVFREAYHPHYRLIHKKYVDLFPVLFKIAELLDKKEKIIISIDGNCGSGKTTCAFIIQEVFGGNLIHMDDYYLPIKERRADWKETPAGNMNLYRFRDEVLKPAKEGKTINYRVFDCQKQIYKEATILSTDRLTIVEGSYSQHPKLAEYYDLKIFLSCDKSLQKKRLMEREGDYYPMFETCWIPLENLYHERFQIKEKADILCEMLLDMT